MEENKIPSEVEKTCDTKILFSRKLLFVRERKRGKKNYTAIQ